jgi:hypothetical protein
MTPAIAMHDTLIDFLSFIGSELSFLPSRRREIPWVGHADVRADSRGL